MKQSFEEVADRAIEIEDGMLHSSDRKGGKNA